MEFSLSSISNIATDDLEKSVRLLDEALSSEGKSLLRTSRNSPLRRTPISRRRGGNYGSDRHSTGNTSVRWARNIHDLSITCGPDDMSALFHDQTTGVLLREQAPWKNGKHSKRKVSDENVERIREAFQRSPRKSIRQASVQLNIPPTTVHTVLHKRLRLRAYKLQLHQMITNDKLERKRFAETIIIGPYFFAEKTVTANTYLDMLQLYAVPQLPDGAIFQQDGAPPHFANMVRTFLDEQFPARWIGRGTMFEMGRMGKPRNAYRVLVGRPRRRWEDNIKMDFRELGYDVTNKLYVEFLESLQSHGTERQVFDTVADFIQNCTDTLEVLRNMERKMAQRIHLLPQSEDWLQEERNTWRLVYCLYQNRISSHLISADGHRQTGEEIMDIAQVQQSEKEIVQQLYKNDNITRECQLVIDWLEQNALDSMRDEACLQHFTDKTIAWENTLHQLQEDEVRLEKEVFVQIRCGRLEQAQLLCMHTGQEWRAAALEGWRLFNDPNYRAKGENGTEKLPIDGNPNRDIWKLMAWQLAEDKRMPLHTRATFGSLCGHLSSLIAVCKTWEDLLWAYLRTLVDIRVEKEIRSSSVYEYVQLPDNYWRNEIDIEEVFSELAASKEEDIRKGAFEMVHRIQQFLILDQVGTLMNEMEKWIKLPGEERPQSLRFLSHLILFFRLIGRAEKEDIGDAVIQAYVKGIVNCAKTVLNLTSDTNIIRNIKSRHLRWAGHVACMGEPTNAYSVLVGRPEGKRPLRRTRRRWKDNIKMDMRLVDYDGDWINLAENRDRWQSYGNEPLGCLKAICKVIRRFSNRSELMQMRDSHLVAHYVAKLPQEDQVLLYAEFLADITESSERELALSAAEEADLDIETITRTVVENISKEIDLEVNPEKTKYMIMSCDENIVRNGNIKFENLSFEEVEKFKYLGATVTNINDTREEIKHRINMGNACYYSVEKLLSSRLLSKNLKVRIYKTVILPVVLYGCETWTLNLREERRLRVFENKVLRKIFGAKRDEVTGDWRKLHNTELYALYSSPDIIRNIKFRRLRWAGHVAHVGESKNAYRVNQETTPEMPDLHAGLTPEDMVKVSALDWVVYYTSQRAEAIWQANALVRHFLAVSKLEAARKAFNKVLEFIPYYRCLAKQSWPVANLNAATDDAQSLMFTSYKSIGVPSF
ncbi:hypothetical protein ANN_20089 [Periplaneta americana]|uniref:Nuclear pore complex protein n=1 Tax=Periplaneta americana TaxID=6978 RepID=A0ABQ8SCB6_PERAM|nr:hypothetical protein ANN_20089 [Periplaneta americana]